MNNILWLSNHPCSQEQQDDLQSLFGDVLVVTELGSTGKKLWSAVPPDADLEGVGQLFWSALETVHGGNLSDFDTVVVMGELSLCLVVVTECVMDHVSVYTPTTTRESVESVQPDGSVRKTNVFKHCQLRCLHDAD